MTLTAEIDDIFDEEDEAARERRAEAHAYWTKEYAKDFPLHHFSPSSLVAFWKCHEQFRRERIKGEKSPTGSSAIFGTAFHKVAQFNYEQKLETHRDIIESAVTDVALWAWDTTLEKELGQREISWDEAPGKVLDKLKPAVLTYHREVAPKVQPVAVERRVERETHVGVPMLGYIDVETEAGRIIDLKTTGKSKNQQGIDADIQATAYMWARNDEGNPATGFDWHVYVRKAKPELQLLSSTRDEAQLTWFDWFVGHTHKAIALLMLNPGPDEPWPGTIPMAYWCAASQCSFYSNCPSRGGGRA